MIENDERLLDKAGVAALMGWSSPNHVDVNQHRTRAGTASVPFPAPVDPQAPIADHRWRTSDIEAYRNRRQQRHEVTGADVRRMKQLRAADLSLDEIAAATGFSRATVHRVVTGRHHESS